MLGIRCWSGPTPVVIVAAHTGVTDGKAATHSDTYAPCSAILRRAGARPDAIARSSISGLSASITTRTSFLFTSGSAVAPGGASPQDPQPGVLLLIPLAATQEQPQQRQQRDQPERRGHHRQQPD